MENKPKFSFPVFRAGIGQDSHRFTSEELSKPCIIGGVIFEDVPGLDADSDGDVVYHAICNAITSLTKLPVLGKIARELCKKDGITDSQVYVEKAMGSLGHQKIVHVALTIEGKKPYMQNQLSKMEENIARILKIEKSQVGISVTSGDGLTDFGCGDGLQCFCIFTTVEEPAI
jgi:2-C-methyl-D-erythritol 2,4-cyclodiphosphate synthase